jgi:hypothetical protein
VVACDLTAFCDRELFLPAVLVDADHVELIDVIEDFAFERIGKFVADLDHGPA